MPVLILLLVLLAIFYNIIVTFIDAIKRKDWGFLLLWGVYAYIGYLIFTKLTH